MPTPTTVCIPTCNHPQRHQGFCPLWSSLQPPRQARMLTSCKHAVHAILSVAGLPHLTTISPACLLLTELKTGASIRSLPTPLLHRGLPLLSYLSPLPNIEVGNASRFLLGLVILLHLSCQVYVGQPIVNQRNYQICTHLFSVCVSSKAIPRPSRVPIGHFLPLCCPELAVFISHVIQLIL